MKTSEAFFSVDRGSNDDVQKRVKIRNKQQKKSNYGAETEVIKKKIVIMGLSRMLIMILW